MKYVLIFIMAVMMSISFVVSCTAQSSDTETGHAAEESVKITLTIGDKVIPAILYNTPPAKDLMKKMPVTVSLNRGPVDYCGGIAPIAHNKNDLEAGYRSGDLAYWIPGQDFVIFTENKKDASGSPDLVILGQIRSDISEIRNLDRRIDVTIALQRQD